MRKVIIWLSLFISFIAPIALDASSAHLKALKGKHPFALIGEDYGILTETDLAINACMAPPVPFSSESTAYPYWQCFSTRNSYFECDGSYDEFDKTTSAIMAIGFRENNQVYEYLSPRGIPIEDCRSFENDWMRITKKQEHVCVSGSLIPSKMNDGEKKKTSWIFESFKTTKGCVSYFKGGCDLKYQLKAGCKR